jgi:tetratricopeptide (TPR) repeat protein
MERTDYFEILGVAPGASAEEIERAFREKVKLHPPRKDPEGFKRINEAARLRDPDFRRDYVEGLKTAEIGELLEEYGKYMGEQNSPAALDCVNRALAKQPKLPVLYNMKGHSLVTLKRYPEAIESYQEAYRLHPSTVYIYNIACTYYDNSDYAAAESNLANVLRIEPGHVKALVLLSKVYNRQGKLDESVRLLEGVISRNFKTEMDYLEVLLQLMTTYALNGGLEEFKGALSQLKSIIRAEDAEKVWVASKLWDLCQQLTQGEYFEVTYQLLLFCQEIEYDPGLEEMVKYYHAARGVEDLIGDDAVATPLKLVFILMFYRLNSEEHRELEAKFNQELAFYLKNDLPALENSLRRIKTGYPDLYRHNPQEMLRLEKIVHPRETFWTRPAGRMVLAIAIVMFLTGVFWVLLKLR